jgi:serine/threonine-protein phosphatase 2A activator
MASSRTTDGHGLAVLDTNASHGFIVPCKRINEGQDMSTFLTSMAYRDIMTFLMQLNHSMFPSLGGKSARGSMKDQIVTFEINDSRRRFSKPTVQLQKLLKALDDMNDEVELDTGPRRFGNVSFRKWGELLQSRSIDLLKKYLRPVLTIPDEQSTPGPLDELNAYLVGSFGSSQRLDYGTGHELSFLAFLGCLWKLGAFGPSPSEDDQRDLVLGVIEPYVTCIAR